MNDLIETLRGIGRARGWVAAQYWATALIVLAGLAWTRLPDKHAWQVGLTLLVPLLLLAAFLYLEAGTIRRLVRDEPTRTGSIHGALTLLVWIAIVCLAWAILDWCDDQTIVWAGYLNSRAPAQLRATLFTYAHIQLWITTLIWISRWIVLPAKVLPHAVASAQWGWRLPWRKSLGLVLNWRWWIAVAVAAIAGVALPAEPAEVPRIRSALRGSTHSSLRPKSRPVIQAMPATPPPPRTSARSFMIFKMYHRGVCTS